MLRSYAGLLASAAFLVACSSQDRAPPAVETDSGGAIVAADTGTRVDASSEAAIEADVAVDGSETDATDALDDTGEAGALDGGDAADATGDAGKVCLPALTTSPSSGTCKPLIQSWQDEGHNHVSGDVTYCTSPPSSGDHYGVWANYTVYDAPVPYGNLVHSLEHGAVVLLYRCPTAMLPCKTTQNALVAIADAQPVDPLCMAPIKRRIIVAPDPTLDIAIGASAWQWTYRAECVDSASLGAFVTAHYAKATEDTCAPP
jgi:hypothetical protein